MDLTNYKKWLAIDLTNMKILNSFDSRDEGYEYNETTRNPSDTMTKQEYSFIMRTNNEKNRS